MHKRLVLFACAALPAVALAQTADAPGFKVGDTWVVRLTREKAPSGWEQVREEMAVARVTGSRLYITVKKAESPQPPREVVTGLDWSRLRSLNGKETTVTRPLVFPLAPGKSWTLRFTDPHPDAQHREVAWESTFRVLGYETVEVPAGRFNALKIESEGTWVAQRAPGQSVSQAATTTAAGTTMTTQTRKTEAETVAGRTYKAFWYVPEVKYWVKSEEEMFDGRGVRVNRVGMELESFKPGP